MVVLLAFWLGAHAEACDLVLVDEGVPAAVVVVPAEASAVESFAARELVEHLEVMTGAALPIYAEGSAALGGVPRRMVRVKVGQTVAGRELEVPDGGFAIRARRRELVLVGHDDPGPDGVFQVLGDYDQTGTLSAVYELLQDELGVRWLWPGASGTHVPERASVRLPRRLERTEEPGLRHRRMDSVYTPRWQARYLEAYSWLQPAVLAQRGREHALWMRRMRLAGHLPWRAGGHAYATWFDRFRETRPDYFALQPDGVRGPFSHKSTVKICASQPGVWDQVIADWAAADLRSQTLTVAENDGDYGYCTCAACRGLDVDGATWVDSDGVERPKHTDRYVHLANAVAERLADRDPDWGVRLYAYNAAQDPPEREVPRENVAVEVVEGQYPATAESRERFRAHWRSWRGAVGGRLGWRPNVHHTGYGLPVGYTEDLANDLDFLVAEGLDYLAFDAMTASIATAGPAYYLAARKGWDTRRSSAEILEEFYAGFGAAGPHVRAAYAVWDGVAERLVSEEGRALRLAQGPGLHRNTRYALARLTRDEDYARADGHLQDALAAVDAPLQRERIRALREGIAHSRRMAEVLLALQGTDRRWLFAETHLPPVRGLRDARVALSTGGVVPVAFLSWSEGVGGDLTGLQMLEDVGGSEALVRPPILWWARLDPEDRGRDAGWQDIAPRDAGWQRVRTDRTIQQSRLGRSWERQHDWEPYRGAAWYRVELIPPADTAERARALLLPDVRGAVTVWVDGRLVAERSEGAGALRIELPEGLPAIAVVTVRVDASEGPAGLARPPWLLAR